MVTIYKEGIRKIMHLFYRSKNISLHLREIARQAKLHEPSTSRFLNLLEKQGVLKAEKEGNLKKYKVRHNNVTHLILESFDIEKLNKLPLLRKNGISNYLNKLPEKPVFAILFGSTAKETYRDDSDIDILIITNKKVNPREAEREASALSAMNVSTFQMTYKNFLKELKMKNDNVVQSAIFSGYPLINHLTYYEVLYNEGL